MRQFFTRCSFAALVVAVSLPQLAGAGGLPGGGARARFQLDLQTFRIHRPATPVFFLGPPQLVEARFFQPQFQPTPFFVDPRGGFPGYTGIPFNGGSGCYGGFSGGSQFSLSGSPYSGLYSSGYNSPQWGGSPFGRVY